MTTAQVEPHGPESLRHPLTDREADVRDLLDRLAWLAGQVRDLEGGDR